jgi:hypothetical protein
MASRSMMGLDQETIQALLKAETTKRRSYDNPHRIPQSGPLRWFDYEMRCASLGCNSPTYAKVEGAPRCAMHALKELNQMVINLTPQYSAA